MLLLWHPPLQLSSHSETCRNQIQDLKTNEEFQLLQTPNSVLFISRECKVAESLVCFCLIGIFIVKLKNNQCCFEMFILLHVIHLIYRLTFVQFSLYKSDHRIGIDGYFSTDSDGYEHWRRTITDIWNQNTFVEKTKKPLGQNSESFLPKILYLGIILRYFIWIFTFFCDFTLQLLCIYLIEVISS